MHVSLWVIGAASCCVSCSQHLVVEPLAQLLCGIQMGGVKDSVIAVQLWNQSVLLAT